MLFDYDLIVIGGGPGGYTAAIRGAQLGAKTALVEKAALGGVCLNKGCIPTKAFIESAKRLSDLKEAAAFGIEAEIKSLDFKIIRERKNKLVNNLSRGIEGLLQKNGVQIYNGAAAFIDEESISVNGQILRGKKFIIATGAVPKRPRSLENNQHIIDSDAILNLEELPESLIILGGGVIGIEFAGIFNALGVKVTVLEYCDEILPGFDREIAGALRKALKRQKINIELNADIVDVQKEDGGDFIVKYQQKGIEKAVLSSLVLCATGRRAEFSELQIEKAGIKALPEGILVDSLLLTNKKHIGAIGDVKGGIQLAHLASAEGISLAEVFFAGRLKIDNAIIPACLYSRPEFASVGMTEEEIIRKSIPYGKGVFPLAASGKAQIMGRPAGMVKVLFSKGDGALLGLHILAPGATEMIMEGALALNRGMTIEEIASIIHPHPTISEAIAEAAYLALGKPINI